MTGSFYKYYRECKENNDNKFQDETQESHQLVILNCVSFRQTLVIFRHVKHAFGLIKNVSVHTQIKTYVLELEV